MSREMGIEAPSDIIRTFRAYELETARQELLNLARRYRRIPELANVWTYIEMTLAGPKA